MNAVTKTNTTAMTLEKVLVEGDLSKLGPEQRIEYYRRVCESVGLNPLTQPFAYITLQGKLSLYAKRDAADQLRKIHGISIEIVSRTVEDGLLTVHVRARDASGRTDEDLGVVNIANLKGEAAANAALKAVTKAKRRVTLSISGLGFLDETEVEDIPSSTKRPAAPEQPAIAKPEPMAPPTDPETGELTPHIIAVTQTADDKPDFRLWASTFIAAVKASTSIAEANAWSDLNAVPIASLKQYAPKMYNNMMAAVGKHRDTLAPEAEPIDDAEIADDSADQLNLLQAG